MRTALLIAGWVLGGMALLGTLLSLLRAKAWWIRVWDFPRLQLLVAGSLGLVLALAAWPVGGAANVAFLVAVAAAIAWQTKRVWRYTRLAPLEVQPSRGDDDASRLTIVVSNVLQDNRDADRLLRAVRAADPDLVLLVETDAWWRERVDALLATHTHAVHVPLDNMYGMLLYSRLPLEDPEVLFRVEPDIPSIRTTVRLRSGVAVHLNCVHPRPPGPTENEESTERDAELLMVAREVSDLDGPVMLCGDLNDVAWSRTTRLFQKVSRLLDPRKGRGFFSTFPAHLPGLRCPLDHVFHSADFRLETMRLLDNIGSDHLPVYVALRYEPQARQEQAAPSADHDDMREAAETIAASKTTLGST